MNASELRIGNLIFIDNGEKPKYEYSVCGWDIEKIEDAGDDCFPIPLTEEWLLKFGFEKIMKDNFHSGHYGIKVRSIYKNFVFHTQYPPSHPPEHFNWNTSVYFNEQQVYVLDGLQFVHQLQNLYFALTGEELTINRAASIADSANINAYLMPGDHGNREHHSKV